MNLIVIHNQIFKTLPHYLTHKSRGMENFIVGSYQTITDAVNVAQSGDTIILEPGTYYENNININTNMSIQVKPKQEL